MWFGQRMRVSRCSSVGGRKRLTLDDMLRVAFAGMIIPTQQDNAILDGCHGVGTMDIA